MCLCLSSPALWVQVPPSAPFPFKYQLVTLIWKSRRGINLLLPVVSATSFDFQMTFLQLSHNWKYTTIDHELGTNKAQIRRRAEWQTYPSLQWSHEKHQFNDCVKRGLKSFALYYFVPPYDKLNWIKPKYFERGSKDCNGNQDQQIVWDIQHTSPKPISSQITRSKKDWAVRIFCSWRAARWQWYRPAGGVRAGS